MQIFWNDSGRGPAGDSPIEVDLEEARRIWLDEVRGAEGNYLGLIDDQDRTIQFRFDEGIPDHVDDAAYLRIVSVDFPQERLGGSYAAQVELREVEALMERAFEVGADFQCYAGLTFQLW